MEIKLKEHNIRPYRELCRKLDEQRHCAYVAATGTGKSYVAAKYLEEHGLIGHELILVPSDAIREAWKKLIPGVRVETYQGILTGAPDLSDVGIIVCDEMHHLGARVWGRAYHSLIESFDGKVVGLTATPVRYLDESRDMGHELFGGNVVEGMNLPEAISAGVLPSFEYIAALYSLEGRIPERARKYDGTKELVHQLDLMASRYSFQNILKKHLEPEGHKIAVFAPSTKAIPELMQACMETYPDAGHYAFHYGVDAAARREALKAFGLGGQTFIYTVDMLNEGVHIKGVDTVIMFRKTESPAVYLQQLGRALDNGNASSRVKIFDFVANHSNLKANNSNMKAYLDGAKSAVDWIMGGITDPLRQVIVSDYAIEELEILDRICALLPYRFTPEEDALIMEHYRKPDGKKVLASLLPNRTVAQIRSRAFYLGLASPRKSVRTPEFMQDVARFYNEPGGKEQILALHPDANREHVRYAAKKLGIAKLNCFTPEEDALLKEHYGKPDGKKVLAALLPNRTEVQIRSRASYIGLSSRMEVQTPEFIQDVKRLYNEPGGMEQILALHPGANKWNVKYAAKKLGITNSKGPVRKWTPEEDDVIRGNQGMADAELARLLQGRTLQAVGNRRYKLGLYQDRGKWTPEEDAVIRENQGMTDKELARLLQGRAPRAVNSRRYKLGLYQDGGLWDTAMDNIILQNAAMSVKELRERYFPHRSLNSVKVRRIKVLRKAAETDTWDDGRKARFTLLYQQGERHVSADREFSGMPLVMVRAAAETLGLSVNKRKPVAWTEEDERKMEECIRRGLGNKEIAGLFPGHTAKAVMAKKYDVKKKLIAKEAKEA